jgi:acetone carboxylase gamma subunit
MKGFLTILNIYVGMIYCPNCGFSLNSYLTDGISTCLNCHRAFDTSKKNRLLSAAWCVRRRNLYDIDELKRYNNLTDKEWEFINHYIINEDLTHDEILKLFKFSCVII